MEGQNEDFKNKAREYDDGTSFITEIKKNCEWRYKYIPPGTHKNPTPIWKFPSCKKMIEHLRICGGDVSYMMNLICDGVRCNMQQLYVAILDEFAQQQNEAENQEWERIIKLGEKAAERFGDDALLRLYKDGTVKPGVAQILAGKRKGSASSQPVLTPENDAGLAMLADLSSSGDEV